MLQRTSRNPSDDSFESGDSLSEAIDFDKMLAVVRRQWRVTAFAIAIAIAFAVAYLLTAVPLYTATTDVMIDQNNGKLVDQLSVVGGGIEDETSILSQVELLRSEKIGLDVVDKLNLANDPAFMSSAGSPLTRLRELIRSLTNVSSWFGSKEITPDESEARRQAALGRVLGAVDVSRVGRTYVLQVNFTSPSPQLAAKIAQGIADAYLTDQLDSKYEATRRASDWLQNRIAELRKKALETDLAVQKFKTEKGLISTNGQLVSDQQLTELNSALVAAQSESAKAKARYDHIKSLIDSGRTDAIVTDALDNTVISSMRAKYLDAAKREADISARFGSNHAQAVRLRGEMDEYKRLMFEELSRIAEGYLSDFKVAQDREASLREQVAMATGVSASDNETQVQLRELEREAESYRDLYKTFLQRYQEAVQQQSFPVTEARVISNASAPGSPSSPKKFVALALSILLGGMIGVGIGAFREYRDRFFRVGDQVREETGLEFLGVVPLVGSDAMPTVLEEGADEVHKRIVRKTSTVANFVIDHPLSAFAETLRSAKIAADFTLGDRRPKVIGIVSTLPGEGKTTVSINFAELLASQGSRTLLIDADFRNPGLTRGTARHATAGLLEALVDGRPLKDLVVMNPSTRLAILPVASRRIIPHSAELLTSPAMDAMLQQAGESFDHIVVDLPPISPVVDARAFASRVDAFIFVVEWGKTSRRAVRSLVASEPKIFSKCLGVVLNKADQDKMKLYRTYGSSEYYSSRYQAYYRE